MVKWNVPPLPPRRQPLEQTDPALAAHLVAAHGWNLDMLDSHILPNGVENWRWWHWTMHQKTGWTVGPNGPATEAPEWDHDHAPDDPLIAQSN